MLLGHNREILGRVSENFSLELFERFRFRKLANEILDRTGRRNKRDCPLKPMFVMWVVLALALHRTLSIANVFRKLVALCQESEPELAPRPVTDEAVIHAKNRLGSEPFRQLFEGLASEGHETASFEGFRVWGIDGVEFSMPDTPQNLKQFPKLRTGRGKAAFPGLRAVCLVNTVNRQIKDASFSGKDRAERSHLEPLLEKHLGTGDIVILDRGLSATWVFVACQSRDINYLARMPVHWKFRSKRRLGVGDHLVELRNCFTRRRYLRRHGLDDKTPLRMRLISYRVADGETVSLLTSLTDPERFPAKELAFLYHQRWECELAYNELKNHLAVVAHSKQKTTFRSKTPDGVKQEAYALLTVYNLIRSLIQETAREHGLPPTEYSFTDTLQVLEIWIPRLQRTSRRQFSKSWRQFLVSLSKCRLKRPRRPRQYPRKVKKKMTKFQVKREGDVGRMLDFQKELLLVDQGVQFHGH